MFEGAEGYQAILSALGGNGTQDVTICKRTAKKNKVRFTVLTGDIGVKLYMIRNARDYDV